MNKNYNSFSSLPTFQGYKNNNNNLNYIYPNSNNQIRNYVNFNTNNQQKKVTFNKDVVVYNVESYKEHNKKFCYKEDEQYEYLFGKKKNGYNDYYYKKYSNQFNNPKDSIKKEDNNKCCCIIL